MRRMSPLNDGLGRRDERRADGVRRRHRRAGASERHRYAGCCDDLKGRGGRVARLTSAAHGMSCSSVVNRRGRDRHVDAIESSHRARCVGVRGTRSSCRCREHPLDIAHHAHARRRSNHVHKQRLKSDAAKIPNRHHCNEGAQRSGAARRTKQTAHVEHDA
jgi:hypothetical protein